MGAKPTVKTNYLLTQIFYYENIYFNTQIENQKSNHLFLLYSCHTGNSLQYYLCRH